MTSRNLASKRVSPLVRKLSSWIIFAASALSALGVASAQDVTYQESLSDGESVTLTVQNYAPGSSLSNSNFVSFSVGSSLVESSAQFFGPTPGCQNSLGGDLSNSSLGAVTLSLVVCQANGYTEYYQSSDTLQEIVLYQYGVGHGNGTTARNVLEVIPSLAFHTISAPEMDVNSAGSALTLLLGGVLVIRGGFRRS